MTSYLVKWEIDIEADSPIKAAKEARLIQQDPFSEALVFDVYTSNIAERNSLIQTVDLLLDEE